jgi:methyl-accepting chemotaxis protein
MKGVLQRYGIRSLLLAGFGALMVMLAAAGLFGWASMTSVASAIRQEMRGVEQDARLSTALATDVARQVAEAARYVDGGDVEAAYDSLRTVTHRTQRVLRRREGQTQDEVALVVGIDQALSDAEVRYVVARRLRGLGRADEARAQADSARVIEAAMLGQLGRLADVKAHRVARASADLEAATGRRAMLLVVLLGAALTVAGLVVYAVVPSIAGPMEALRTHAGRLSEGDLTARTEGALPGELGVLAAAMNRTSESLSEIGAGAITAADGIAASAEELTAASSQLAASVAEVTRSIDQVSGGAATQVAQLRQVDDSLRAIRAQAEQVAADARDVHDLAADIERLGREKRAETVRTMEALLRVRGAVQAAAGETAQLHDAVGDIRSFVEMVNRIAEQTNLLGLNASIEAARAGQHGTGFTVVAEEVRKLAAEARAGAERVKEVTRVVTERVDSTARAMAAGAAQVEEVERHAHAVEDALSTIVVASERARRAADSVTAAASANAAAADDAAGGIALVSGTAASHAEMAAEVRAATAQQEGACSFVTDATQRLQHSSGQLRELVAGLRVNGAAHASSPSESPPSPPKFLSPLPRIAIGGASGGDGDGAAQESSPAPGTRRRDRVRIAAV